VTAYSLMGHLATLAHVRFVCPASGHRLLPPAGAERCRAAPARQETLRSLGMRTAPANDQRNADEIEDNEADRYHRPPEPATRERVGHEEDDRSANHHRSAD
jgi:hypothetical protein